MRGYNVGGHNKPVLSTPHLYYVKRVMDIEIPVCSVVEVPTLLSMPAVHLANATHIHFHFLRRMRLDEESSLCLGVDWRRRSRLMFCQRTRFCRSWRVCPVGRVD